MQDYNTEAVYNDKKLSLSMTKHQYVSICEKLDHLKLLHSVHMAYISTHAHLV